MINDDNLDGCDECGYTDCRCDIGCDCCEQCWGPDGGGCGPLPEYTCPGACERRGEPGHYALKPAGDPHPRLSYPERICWQPCCRPPDEPTRNVP